MSKSFFRALAGAGLVCVFASARATPPLTLTPTPLYLDVPVSDIGTDNSLAQSNTSRKLAVGADGTIYALFRSATNGIRIAKSTNRGQSFTPSTQISAVDAPAEIAIANDGDLHVVWAGAGGILHAVSHDGAQTFSAPVTVGPTSASAHMALDGDHVYIVPPTGTVVYHSDDDGATFAQTATGSTFAYSDIFVDPLTHDVLAISDTPSVYFYISTDFGQTFTTPVATGKTVLYSVGALSLSGGLRYLFLAGSGTNLERIEVGTPSYFTATVAATANSTTRSLSADVFGNVVSGYLESGTNDLKFQNSNDLAATFASATTVAQNATRANAAINTINGDILFLYEKANQVYLSTYSRGLIDYDVSVSPSALSFGSVEVNAQSSLPITLTNVSTGAVAVTSITPPAGFAATDTCGGSLAPGATCTVTITFSPTTTGPASGVLSMMLGSVDRQVPLSGAGIAARQTTTTQLDASATDVPLGSNVTLTATVTGSTPSGTVAFTESGVAVSGCATVALSGSAASCTVAAPSAGIKHYAAAYAGDTANRPSASAAVTVNVGVLTVTPGTSAAVGGSITPNTPQSVLNGSTLAFTITADSGYRVATVSGCGGTLSGTTYTTGAITGNCAIMATFAQTDEQVDVVARSKGGGGSMDWLFLGSLLCLFVRRKWVVLAAGLMLGQAQAADLSHWYLGGAFGEARGRQSTSDVDADLARQGFTSGSVDVRHLDRDAYRLFGGYRLTPNWVFEVGYTDLGDVHASASALVPAGQAESYARALLTALPASASGYEATVSYRYPLGDRFAVAARGGVWNWKDEERATFGDQSLRASRDGTDALFGVSFEWSPLPHWAIGVEASRYRTDVENLDLLAADLRFLW